MRIDVITLFPEILQYAGEFGVLRQAIEAEKLDYRLWNPRDFSNDRNRRVDDRPYGGGPGMLMKPEPLAATIDEIRSSQVESNQPQAPLIYLSPQGDRLDQSMIEELVKAPGLILLAGRYEGVDQRLLDSRVDREISIGDYVLAGGEFAALVLIEAISRLLPGVLGNQASAMQDSFSDGLLECPQYTRPENFEGQLTPDVLLAGNHQQIERWRLKQSLGRTWLKRPDLLGQLNLTDDQQALLNEFQLEHKHD